jgi:hypothetical protein
MTRKTIRLVAEPRGQAYRCLLQAAAEQASTAFLVIRESVDLSEGARECLLRLEPYMLSDQSVSEWAGTKLLGGKARMLIYQASAQLVLVLQNYTRGLYDWIQPNLPEDLGFLRNDGSLWLGSTAHEADAWLELETDELARLVTSCPEIATMMDRLRS